MQKETQNNQPDWRKDLHDLDAIPGEPGPAFSKVWERLQAKMQDKPRRVAPYGWMLAAACAACIFFISTLHKEPERIVRKVSENKKIEPAKLILYQPAALVKPNMVKAKYRPSSTHISSSHRMIPDSLVNIIVDTPVAIPVLAVVDTPSVSVKKKLRVVHINELESTSVHKIDQLVRNSPSDKILKIHLAPAN